VQIGTVAYERLGRLAAETGLSRAQIVEFLIESGQFRDHVRALRRAGLRPRPTGRKKKSIFAGLTGALRG